MINPDDDDGNNLQFAPIGPFSIILRNNGGDILSMIGDLWDTRIKRIDFGEILQCRNNAYLIGKGSVAEVYRIKVGDRQYAMKIIPVSYETPQMVETLVREIKKLHSLQHPNIIPVEAYFFPSEEDMNNFTVVDKRCMGFFMEYAHYGSLANVLQAAKNGSLDFNISWFLVMEWLKQISSALAFMHSQNEKHKDVKPANILLFKNYNIKLCDFGLARNGERSLSVEKGLGTCSYMALEIARGEDSQCASDIYSYGITACELIAGGAPKKEFKGRTDKLDRLKLWMKDSRFQEEHGFDRFMVTLLQCLDDDWKQRPKAEDIGNIISAIQYESMNH